MENHPIPQDVTGFKFKLIGSITVKQFLYLLGGGVLATVIFLLPTNIILKIPFMIMFFSTGAAFAFVPVDGRPMDRMMMNFLRTIPSENEYVYHKRGANIAAFEFFQTAKPITKADTNSQTDAEYKKNLFLAQLRNSGYKADDSETAFVKNIKSFFDDSVSEKKPIDADGGITGDAHREAIQPIRVQRIEVAKVANEPVSPPVAETKTTDNSQEADALAHDELLQKAVIKSAQAASDTQKTVIPGLTGTAHVVATDAQLKSGFPTLPDVPNVILGIVKDPRGKILPNILVEVVDGNNTPVRAFKTNALGQFAAATPLPNGVYKVIFEDAQKKNEFNTIEITLTGTIFQPLEVTSIDQREKLRLELFGNTPIQPSINQQHVS